MACRQQQRYLPARNIGRAAHRAMLQGRASRGIMSPPPRDATAMKYLHTMVRVRDLDASLRFYCEGLGLTETRRMESEQGRFTLRRDTIQPPSARKAVTDVVHTNANAEVVIELRPGRRQSGDPDNRLLEVSLAPYFGSDETARLAALLFAMFGGETDVRATPDTPEYLAAVQRARARLPEWRKRFHAGLRPGDILCVKKEFKTPDGQVERMWVEIIEWSDDGAITGVLQNEPVKATDFQEGQQLQFHEADVLDVIHIRPDGTFEGNETGLIKQSTPP